MMIKAGQFFSEHLTNPSQDYFTELVNRALALKWQWNDYCELYGEQKNFVLMNRISSNFFSIYQACVIDHTMMAIGRLTDPAEQRGEKNISIRGLPDCLVNQESKEKVTTSLETLDKNEKLRKIRDWRNKEGSHNDLLIATGKSPSIKESIYHSSIEEVIGHILSIISNSVDYQTDVLFGGPDLKSRFSAHDGNGNYRLMEIIRLGLQKAQETNDPHFVPYPIVES